MKKILSIFLMGVIILLTGCGTENEKVMSSDMVILQNKNISSISLYLHTDVVEITDKEKIQSIKDMFANNKLKRNEKLDESKGWIYKIVTNNSNKEQIDTIFVIDETNIRYESKVYSCHKIDILKLDEIFGFDREKSELDGISASDRED